MKRQEYVAESFFAFCEAVDLVMVKVNKEGVVFAATEVGTVWEPDYDQEQELY